MKGKRVLFASLLLLACTFMIGLAFAKEDYDFEVESKNVKASVWGRVSYTDNSSPLPWVEDVVDYNIHLIGSDSDLITVDNQACLYMEAYKGKTFVESKEVYVCDQRLSVNNKTWKFADKATELRIKITIDETVEKKTLRD
ncbi:MAG: hypothetical protein Q4C48_08275 [Lachnospiraceae bacterium]|nr:hypothetical protein [Lachnospiraceae bacterium]